MKDIKKNGKEQLKNTNKKISRGINEFKEFIAKGNVLDLAVGVIMGGAFSKIVSSLVNDVLMPVIGILIGGIDFSQLSINVADAKIMYGSFVQQIIDFLIIAVCIFAFVKVVQRLTIKKDDVKDEEEEKVEVKKSDEAVLLEEIRDLLKKDREVI